MRKSARVCTILAVIAIFYTTGCVIMGESNTGSPESRPTSAHHDFRVGDTGPAGGLIFFVDVRGEYSGWRYLEAAPVETEWKDVIWSSQNRHIGGTSQDVGAGRANTAAITAWLRANGESGRAAQLCSGLKYNGYDDWFLPSYLELELMQENLRRRNLGSFARDTYWSSSEYDANGAWGQQFGARLIGVSGTVAKARPRRVRAVRAF